MHRLIVLCLLLLGLPMGDEARAMFLLIPDVPESAAVDLNLVNPEAAYSSYSRPAGPEECECGPDCNCTAEEHCGCREERAPAIPVANAIADVADELAQLLDQEDSPASGPPLHEAKHTRTKALGDCDSGACDWRAGGGGFVAGQPLRNLGRGGLGLARRLGQGAWKAATARARARQEHGGPFPLWRAWRARRGW